MCRLRSLSIRYHSVLYWMKSGLYHTEHCPSKDNLADDGTKAIIGGSVDDFDQQRNRYMYVASLNP